MEDGKENQKQFFVSHRSMMQVYKGRFLHQLQQLKASKLIQCTGDDAAWNGLLKEITSIDWVVYAKPPCGGPARVVEYLGRYTNKVALDRRSLQPTTYNQSKGEGGKSNSRIKSISDEGKVLFSYKDYADGNKQKEMKLPAPEFIRRFELHILPKGFTKIRHYGYLSNRERGTRIAAILKQLKLPPPKPVIRMTMQRPCFYVTV